MHQSGVPHFSRINAHLRVGQILTFGALSGAVVLTYDVQNSFALP